MKVVNPTFLFRHGCSTTGDVFVKLKYLSLQPIVDECLISAIFSLSLSLFLFLCFLINLYLPILIYSSIRLESFTRAHAHERERESKSRGMQTAPKGGVRVLAGSFIKQFALSAPCVSGYFLAPRPMHRCNCATLHFSA